MNYEIESSKYYKYSIKLLISRKIMILIPKSPKSIFMTMGLFEKVQVCFGSPCTRACVQTTRVQTEYGADSMPWVQVKRERSDKHGYFDKPLPNFWVCGFHTTPKPWDLTILIRKCNRLICKLPPDPPQLNSMPLCT